MRVRDSNVIHLSEVVGDVPFKMVAQGLLDAINEAEVEGIADPSRDPAVMLFGAYVAFHTHVDVNTVRGYHEQLELCRERQEQGMTRQ